MIVLLTAILPEMDIVLFPTQVAQLHQPNWPHLASPLHGNILTVSDFAVTLASHLSIFTLLKSNYY